MMPLTAGIRLLAAAAAASLIPARSLADAPAPHRIILPDNVAPVHYDITFQPDAKNLTFTGSVSIRLTVRAQTDNIVLNAKDLVIDRAALSDSAVPLVSYDDKLETATFTFPGTVAAGDHVLTLDYHGRIYQQAYGLYAVDYASATGPRRALFTQFENSDARRFVPCWDEPALKATFSLAATVPAGGFSVSNMPISATDDLPGGLARIHFGTSPKMSSYLLFFGYGDLERIHRDVGGTDVGVVFKRGDAASAQYALDTAANLLPYYNDYFGVRYPLPKLDLIAAPGSSTFFSAMENWGAILYFEKALLFDPKISTENDRHRIHSIIAHEMSHQWFGDLVTMQWWDDIWLNEGFASWMQEKATDHFHPEWNVWLRAQVEKDEVMQTDERDGTHPVITPIYDVLQAYSSFDNITYRKGQAVIRMLEAYVGEENFRSGVRRYMKDYAYRNTVTDDFWREVDAVSDRKLTPIAHDFTLHAGVPVITVAHSKDSLIFSEDRFALDSSAESGGSWLVPVVVRLGTDGRPSSTKRILVTDAGRVTQPNVPQGAVVNAGQTGYFRVLYRERALAPLREHFGRLAPEDQLGILEDEEALGEAGETPMSNFLQLASRLAPDTDPVIWAAVSGKLAWLDLLHEGLPTQEAFRTFARGVLAPQLKWIGFDARPGESDNVAILRSSLLSTLGKLADADVVAEARRRFATFLADPSSLSGAARDSVLTIVALNADAGTWEQLRTLSRTATSTLDKQQFPVYLGSARDPDLAARALDLALGEEADLTFRPGFIRSVSQRHPAMAFAFGTGHWDALGGMLADPDRRAAFISILLTTANDPAVLGGLSSFAAAHVSPSQERDIRKIAGQVSYNARVRTERLPEIDRWVASPRKASAR